MFYLSKLPLTINLFFYYDYVSIDYLLTPCLESGGLAFGLLRVSKRAYDPNEIPLLNESFFEFLLF